MNNNDFAIALLDTVPSIEYSPIVLNVKDHQKGMAILNDFKRRCMVQGISLVDGSKLISDNKTLVATDEIHCIMFENIQFISKREHYQECFFELFNYAWINSIPMVITLEEDECFAGFQGRNKSRLRWGISADIT